MVIDYSKWDNMDVDSEPEGSTSPGPPPRVPEPTVPQPAAPAPSTPGMNDTGATSGTSSTSGAPSESSINAVIVRCEMDKAKGAPWSAARVKPDHPVFYSGVPPIPGLIEIPLVFHRLGTQSANQADLDNQIATYINIEAESGFAPPDWQSQVGTVVVARKDKKPLLPHHLEGVWMYCDHILDLFGEGEGAPTHLYNKQAFKRWWSKYCTEQKGFRGGTRGENDPDDWREVRSPYEM